MPQDLSRYREYVVVVEKSFGSVAIYQCPEMGCRRFEVIWIGECMKQVYFENLIFRSQRFLVQAMKINQGAQKAKMGVLMYL
jgi:hypothetical protein